VVRYLGSIRKHSIGTSQASGRLFPALSLQASSPCAISTRPTASRIVTPWTGAAIQSELATVVGPVQ
jgi:hypothetical protein